MKNDLWSRLQKELSAFSDNKNEYPDNTLYHYTSLSGLEGILSTKTLWMTHYKDLNDDKEIKHAVDQILTIIELYINDSENNNFWKLFHDEFRKILDVCDFYISSFCFDFNNPRAWSEYANNGQGVSIGFCKEFFIPRENIGKKRDQYNVTTVQKIHYDSSAFNIYIKNICNHVDRWINESKKTTSSENAINNCFSALTCFLLTVLPKLKEKQGVNINQYWNKERECRIYQIGYKELFNNRLDKKDRIYAMPKTIKNNKHIILKKFKQSSICEIWMGQFCQKNKKFIENLLHKYQFNNIRIRQYRD